MTSPVLPEGVSLLLKALERETEREGASLFKKDETERRDGGRGGGGGGDDVAPLGFAPRFKEAAAFADAAAAALAAS